MLSFMINNDFDVHDRSLAVSTMRNIIMSIENKQRDLKIKSNRFLIFIKFQRK